MTELTPFKLTPLGLFHTLVSILAVVLAFVALFRDGRISPATTLGRSYLWALWITTLTGLPIFRQGPAGPPHFVGIAIIVVLLVAALAGRTRVFGRLSAPVETVCYSLSVFLLMIPTVVETLTRVPPRAPWVSSPEAPVIQALIGLVFVLFLIGVSVQLRQIRAAR